MSEEQVRRKWRYQPVFTEQNGERTYTLIECYFDESGALDAWTEDPAMVPQGDTAKELQGDVTLMLAAVWKWVPVSYDSLCVGMRFKATGVNIERMLRAMNDEAGLP